MNILVTGGTGYIGSHTAVELTKAGYNVVVVDNLVNSSATTIDAIQKITGQRILFEELDVRNTPLLSETLKKHSIEGVIHFAALKAVGESTEKSLLYYENNVGGLLSLLQAMQKANVHKLIFSSSATVYGDPDELPLYETSPLKTTTNPYGETKQMAERIISDVCESSKLRSIILRYFNPIGAHESALIGEQPSGKPNNLVPYVVQAAAKLREPLTVHGNDYPTPDGTGVRDYVHVVDVAKAHVKALEHLQVCSEKTDIYNVGTGKGTSVMQIIKTFEKVNGIKVPYTVGPRRPGDIAMCYANADKAMEKLGWKTEHSLDEALKSAWAWQQTQSKN